MYELYTEIVDTPTENNKALGLSSNDIRSNNYFQGKYEVRLFKMYIMANLFL